MVAARIGVFRGFWTDFRAFWDRFLAEMSTSGRFPRFSHTQGRFPATKQPLWSPVEPVWRGLVVAAWVGVFRRFWTDFGASRSRFLTEMSTSGRFSRFSHTQGRFPPTKKHFGSVPAAFGGLSWWRLLLTNLAGFGRYASPQTFRNIENEQKHNHGNLFSPRTHLDPKVYQFSAPNSIAKVFQGRYLFETCEWHHLLKGQ